jgi:2Fe-2S ferredoxin
VLVLQGGRGLSKLRKDERERLAQIGGKESQSRLSCQAVLGIHKVTIELVNH